MRALLAVLVLLTLACAGCASKGGDEDGADAGTGSGSGSASGTSTKTSSGSGSASGTGTSAPAENRAPKADLGASTAGGALPLQVNFTLNGTDADGDALNWTLSFGDDSADVNGTTLPANATHSFAAAGLYNVTLNVTDGTLSALSFVTINITAAGGGAGQVENLAWDIGTPHQPAGQSSGTPYVDCADGPHKTFNYDSFTLDLATRGQPFKASIAAASGAASIHSWRVFFNVEDCSAFAGGPFTATGAADITGVVPEDAGAFVFVMASGGFLLEATYQSGSQIA